MFLGTGLASDRGTADIASSNAEAAGTVYSLIQRVNSPSSSSDVQSDYCIIGKFIP